MRRLLILIAPLLVAGSACRPAEERSDTTASPTSVSTTEQPATTTEEATTTTATTLPPPTTGTTAPPTTADDGMLRAGATGPEVQALQERLDALGYWLGPIDGTYGPSTVHAVTAFQKAGGLGRDGTVGPQTRDALERAERLVPRSTEGHVIEVDLRRQLVVIADEGRATWVFDSSTGRVPGTTPTGRYEIFRQVNGMDTGPYGPLYRPKYFVGGVALHGYPSVPTTPASHGCVRVTNEAIDMLWDSGTLPIGADVWVH